jgi:predicted MFS family arabinose efflux permease
VPAERRGRAIAITLSGLTVANLIGVPPPPGWGSASAGAAPTYWAVTAVAVLTAVLVRVPVPVVAAGAGTGSRRGLSTLRRPSVWVALPAGHRGHRLAGRLGAAGAGGVRSRDDAGHAGGRLVDWSVRRSNSAFNVANAAGAFGGGLVIDLGFGWTSPAVLGAVLAAAGLAVIAAARLSGTNLSGSSTAGSAAR